MLKCGIQGWDVKILIWVGNFKIEVQIPLVSVEIYKVCFNSLFEVWNSKLKNSILSLNKEFQG